MLSTAILAYGHVLSAIAWLGGGIMFGFIIAPAASKLSPGASAEFFLRIVPNVSRFFQIVAVTTIVFGVLLLYNMGGQSLLDGSTSYGVDLSLGILFALLAFVVSEAVAAPALNKAIRLIRRMAESGRHEPPPELAATMKRVQVSSIAMLVLLLVTVSFMVAAGFYYAHSRAGGRASGSPRLPGEA